MPSFLLFCRKQKNPGQKSLLSGTNIITISAVPPAIGRIRPSHPHTIICAALLRLQLSSLHTSGYGVPAPGRLPVPIHSEAPSKVHSSESSVLPFHHRQFSVTSDLRPVPGTNAAVRSGIQSYPFQGGLEGYSDYLPFLNGLMYLIVGDDCSTLAW